MTPETVPAVDDTLSNALNKLLPEVDAADGGSMMMLEPAVAAVVENHEPKGCGANIGFCAFDFGEGVFRNSRHLNNK